MNDDMRLSAMDRNGECYDGRAIFSGYGVAATHLGVLAPYSPDQIQYTTETLLRSLKAECHGDAEYSQTEERAINAIADHAVAELTRRAVGICKLHNHVQELEAQLAIRAEQEKQLRELYENKDRAWCEEVRDRRLYEAELNKIEELLGGEYDLDNIARAVAEFIVEETVPLQPSSVYNRARLERAKKYLHEVNERNDEGVTQNVAAD